VIKIIAAALDRELRDHGIFLFTRADCEVMLERAIGDAARVAGESLSAPFRPRLVEQDPIT
jgi:hypothetical protein